MRVNMLVAYYKGYTCEYANKPKNPNFKSIPNETFNLKTFVPSFFARIKASWHSFAQTFLNYPNENSE